MPSPAPPTSPSAPVIDSAPSTRCSRTSICRARRCCCSSAPSPDARRCWRRTATPWPPATASTPTATPRCSCSVTALRFEVLATDGTARLGRLTTAHGVVDTPVFMPVGTLGTVKSLTPEDLEGAGAQIVLGNTYHLLLRPGPDVVRDLGGLHRFMGWPRAILTDSGGFQVFSLAKMRKITADGVQFRAPLDGTLRTLTPESVIDIQRALGSDIMMPLDECLAYPATREQTCDSLALTLAWAARARAAHARDGARGQALFGIVQGG